MGSLDYSYTFSAITEKFCKVKVVDHNNRKKVDTIQLAIKDYSLLTQAGRRFPPLVADLIDIASAVSLADRMSIRRDDMPCRIEISLPVRQLELLSQSYIQEKFQDILQWYTDDNWSIKFTKRIGYHRKSEIQLSFIEDAQYETTIILWSGGLDALAGAYHQLSSNIVSHLTLVGSGSNLINHKLQKNVAAGIESLFPNRIQLVQIPFYLKNTKSFSKDSGLRTRGFVFTLLGSACAYLLRQSSLYVYENGIGAINLPFTKAEVGVDHSRSVHPLSLHYMSELISDLFENSFSLRNPYLFSTKAQMCSYLSSNNATDLITRTVSCDRRHRRKPSQCGYCSSCLLRRQALAAQEITDRTQYIITDSASLRKKEPEDSLHLRAMLSQVEDMRTYLNQKDPWESMSNCYSRLREIVDRTYLNERITKEVMKKRLLDMYGSYVREWDIAQPLIGRGLLSYEQIAV